ncbi:MAG: GNAT family N-acetyltransferase [Colwellia sp.]
MNSVLEDDNTLEQNHEEPNSSGVRASFLSANELKLAASLLFQAYHNDPVFLEIFEQDKPGYEQRVRAAIREEINAFWQAKQPMVGLFLKDTMIGVVCLNSPDDTLGSDRFWHWRLKMLLGAGYLSTKQMIEKEKAVLAAVPLNKFHMISFIAVHPLHQHNGFGVHLMAAVNTVLNEHPESEGAAIYATTGKYRQFFEEMDYKFVEQLDIGKVSGALMVYFKNK